MAEDTAQAVEEQTEATETAEGKTQAQSVEFPEAGPGATGAAGSIDILLDMSIPVTVSIGKTQMPVRRLLQLVPGSILELDKSIDAPVDLYLKNTIFASGEVVVVDGRFAVRIMHITGIGGPEIAGEQAQ